MLGMAMGAKATVTVARRSADAQPRTLPPFLVLDMPAVKQRNRAR
ncbi:hypothetical protein ACFQY5_39205 [Paeniroseomonas aquatica]|uniref:Uncharacterized protein n=1 Tax=Paeniroseomonas aquatica TaxID=373043 RepID=A0ABT7ZZI1_9PROT|nr:hypothetical protein [Paeniroseomonas aquatica]MDN3562871.1 hypothetical protein [Paeniroseomonas aquatica]